LDGNETIELGILTRGKPTLGMVLIGLLLQDARNLRIHIVDTSETPVVAREDVASAMRLAFDRGIYCGYEVLRERDRAFSMGRLRLLETLTGPHSCSWMTTSQCPHPAVASLSELKHRHLRYVAPYCANARPSGD